MIIEKTNELRYQYFITTKILRLFSYAVSDSIFFIILLLLLSFLIYYFKIMLYILMSRIYNTNTTYNIGPTSLKS